MAAALAKFRHSNHRIGAHTCTNHTVPYGTALWGGAVPGTSCQASAPESAHQQWGGSPHRTEHWLSVAEGNCVAERRGGEQPEANDQSIIKKMMNSIRPDALASLLAKGEAQNGSRPGKGERQLRDLTCGKNSERRDGSAWGGWR